MDMNIRNIDPALLRKFKGKAITEGFTLHDKIEWLMRRDLENKAVSQPIDRKEKQK